jgi:hypothetical protein
VVKQRETAVDAGPREVVDMQPGLYADVAWHELDATGFTRANFGASGIVDYGYCQESSTSGNTVMCGDFALCIE